MHTEVSPQQSKYLKVYEGLNEDQKKAADIHYGPGLVLAGAGAGKTATMTVRIAKLIEEHGVNPSNIFCATFTNKAANEMKERLKDMVGESRVGGIWMGTFHSLCVRILRDDGHLLGYQMNDSGRTNFVIYDTEDQKKVVADIISDLGFKQRIKDREALSYMDDCKNKLWCPNVAAENVEDDEYGQAKEIQELGSIIYQRYQKKLLQNNAMDFGDIIMKTVELLRDFEQVRNKWQNKFHFVLVDEYQDANYSQLQLLILLAAPYYNLFAIGDDAQSIYGFRGSDISIILGFQKMFPTAQVVNLGINYRSTDTIVQAGASLISHNKNQIQKELSSFHGGDAPIFKVLLNNEKDEASFVSAYIKSNVEKKKNEYGDYAVLYRNNFHSRLIEEQLIKSKIPYHIVGGLSYFGREEVKDFLAYLRISVNNKDTVALERIINKPKRSIGKKTLEHLTEFSLNQKVSLYEAIQMSEHIGALTARQRDSLAGFMRTLELVKEALFDDEVKDIAVRMVKALSLTGLIAHYKDHEKEQEKLENMNELIQVISDYADEEPDKTMEDLILDLSLNSDKKTESEIEDSVKLMTIHASKGLEFPVCLSIGWNQGTFPSSRSIGDGEIEEERRIAYVAVTRAKSDLVLTHTITRRDFSGAEKFQDPSIFLSEIPDDLSRDIDVTD